MHLLEDGAGAFRPRRRAQIDHLRITGVRSKRGRLHSFNLPLRQFLRLIHDDDVIGLAARAG